MFDREKVIEALIDDDMEYINSNVSGGLELLESYLRHGFMGYDHMTNNELVGECDERGMTYLVGEDDDTFIDVNETGGKW